MKIPGDRAPPLKHANGQPNRTGNIAQPAVSPALFLPSLPANFSPRGRTMLYLYTDVHGNQSRNFSVGVTETACPFSGGGQGSEPEDPHNYLGLVGAVVIGLQIILGCLGNMFVILAVLSTKTLRKSVNAFIVTLAVTDILFTSMVMPFYIESFVHRTWRLGRPLCIFHTYFGVVLEIASVWQISAIAFYRYLLIVQPHLYNRFSTWPKITLVTVGIFLFSLIVILPNLFRLDGEIAYSDQLGRCNFVRRESKLTLYWFFCAAYIPSGLCMILCYLRIVKALKVSKARVNIRIQFSKSPSSSHRLSDPMPRANKRHSRARMGNRLSLPPGPSHLMPPNMAVEGSTLTTPQYSSTRTEDPSGDGSGSSSTLKLSPASSTEEVFRPRAMTWPSSRINDTGESTQASEAARGERSAETNTPLVSRPVSPSCNQAAHSFRMILVIFITFILTYMPFTIVNLADVHSCFSRTSYMLTSLFFWMGVCVNPFIYGAMNSNFLQAYKTLLLKCWPKKATAAWF